MFLFIAAINFFLMAAIVLENVDTPARESYTPFHYRKATMLK